MTLGQETLMGGLLYGVASSFPWSLSSGGPQAGRALMLCRRALSFEVCVPHGCLPRSWLGLQVWSLRRCETPARAPAGRSVTPAPLRNFAVWPR